MPREPNQSSSAWVAPWGVLQALHPFAKSTALCKRGGAPSRPPQLPAARPCPEPPEKDEQGSSHPETHGLDGAITTPTPGSGETQAETEARWKPKPGWSPGAAGRAVLAAAGPTRRGGTSPAGSSGGGTPGGSAGSAGCLQQQPWRGAASPCAALPNRPLPALKYQGNYSSGSQRPEQWRWRLATGAPRGPRAPRCPRVRGTAGTSHGHAAGAPNTSPKCGH